MVVVSKRRSDPAFATISSCQAYAEEHQVRQSYKTFFLWAILILLFLSFYKVFSGTKSSEPRKMSVWNGRSGWPGSASGAEPSSHTGTPRA